MMDIFADRNTGYDLRRSNDSQQHWNAPKHVQTVIFGSPGKQDRLFI